MLSYWRSGKARCWLALSLSLLLSACGGGGGGGGAAPTPGGNTGGAFTVSIDRTELKFAAEEGVTILPQVVTGTGSGTPPGVIYTGSLDNGTALENVTVDIAAAQVRFTVYPKSNLAPGEYKGSLQLFACADSKCAKHFTGSPATIPYTVTISKGFKVTPATVPLSALSGATASANVAVQLADGQSAYEAVSSASWLAVSNLGASGFTLTTQALPPGAYSATVTVTSGGRSRDVTVIHSVTGDSTTVTSITPDVTSLAFATVATGTTASRTVNVTLPSWSNILNAQIRYADGASGWLNLAQAGARSYALSANAATLDAGSYHADLVFSSGAYTTPVTVPVTFSVGAANLSVAGVTGFEVSTGTTAASLASDLAVDLPGLPAQSWSASSNAAWLKLSSSSGLTGSAGLHVTVDVAEMLKLANFQVHPAVVTVAVANARIAPAKVAFSLAKALPELHYVSPHTRLPGEGGTYTVRGRGIDRIADLQQALQVAGGTPLAVTRVSDTELSVQLAGAASGQVSFALSNAMGIPTGAPAVQVLPQGAFAYQAVATQGAKGGIVFDPERQSVYSANKTLHAAMRFAWNGSGWDVSSASVAGIDAVAMSPDGKSLVATSTSGSIVLLDPSSLSVQGSYSTASVSGDPLNSLPRLAITNSGRAFFQGGTWGALSYFDLPTRQFGAVGTSLQTSFYGGPWFSVSGDGSRLDIVQSASITPSPGMLYMNSSDEVLKLNPAGLTFWYEAAQSLRGERFVEGTNKVWDRDFNLIGNLALPDSSFFGRTPVVSPDGTRVYILAYSSAGAQPRVYVFDSSTRMVVNTNLPVLGYFPLADFPTCSDLNAYSCDTRALGTISPDGKTLFFIGGTNLVVAPIPALTATSQPVSIQRARAVAATLPARAVPVRAGSGH